jgi:hypothetical protein
VRFSGRVRDHFRHNIVGYIALFCFVLGGTAIALPGRNKVDTGDIKKNAVRTSDIAPRAVTAAKIAPRSVDGLRVIDHSLTGEDIDQSTLNIHPAPNSIGPTELADRQRRLVFAPATLLLGATGGEEPKLETVGPFPVVAYQNNANDFGSLATDVPGSRVEGTKMTVRVVWSSSASGTALWHLAYGVVGTGGSVESAATTEAETESATSSGQLSTATFEIPAGAATNGVVLGMTVERDGTNVNDTLPGAARLQLIEIDYTSNG